MATDSTNAKRTYWNAQHQLLSGMIRKPSDHPKAIRLFLSHHGAIHSAAWNKDCPWSFQDQVLFGLTEKQMRTIPAGCTHSVLWKVWHITRIEDVTLNVLLAGSTQVLHRGAWRSRLHARTEEVGNGMDRDAVERLSRAVDWKALLEYRQAVGKRTQTIVQRIARDKLDSKPAPDRLARLITEGTVSEQSQWLLSYWGGHPCANLLLMPATRHPFVHWNEVMRMRPKLARIN